jgi:hypothetical protein
MPDLRLFLWKIEKPNEDNSKVPIVKFGYRLTSQAPATFSRPE